MTYSILLRDPENGDLGVAVQSHFFAVGRFVPWAAAGIGVAVTQSVVEPAYGRDGLQLLDEGVPPEEALDALRDRDLGHETRQVAIMDAAGRVAAFTGARCIPCAGHVAEQGVSVQANLVESEQVWLAMSEAARQPGSLARRLLLALRAAESAGGDIRGRQSAALLVVRGTASGRMTDDLVVDLRVDDAPDPLAELERLLVHHEAFGGLLALLETEGLFAGPFTAAPAVVEAAVSTLTGAERALGRENVEPMVWRGLLHARAGDDEQARKAFAAASSVEPRTPELVRRLGAAGMWPDDPNALAALLGPIARDTDSHR